MVLFVDYLQSRSVGEGAKSIYQRFKKVIRYAIEHDVILKDLTYKNVDYSNKLLKFEQNKTKGHSSASGVVIPLNDGLVSIIGEPLADGNKVCCLCLQRVLNGTSPYVSARYVRANWLLF